MNWESQYLQFKQHAALDSLKANEQRQKSYEKLSQFGLPTKKDEAWKYTSLTDFKAINWSLHPNEEVNLTHEQMQEVSRNLPSEFINFVFVNGQLNKTLSDDLEDWIVLSEVEDRDFENTETTVEAGLLLLAQTFANKKISLQLRKHKVIEKTVQLVFVQSSAESVYLSEKLNITLEENSEMKLLIHTMSFANSTADAMNLNINIDCQAASRLTLVQLQNEDLQSFHFSQINANVQSSATLQSLALTLGNHLTRNYYELHFSSEQATAQVYGLSVLDQQQHADNYTYIKHDQGHNQSIQHYKSIIAGQAHSVFRGRVFIAPQAQKANSEQLNNNLLLTRQAQADTIPQLEIFADDVKAGHGATVGQLNKEEIFYFLSRGINQFQAVKMLSTGFAAELIYKFEDKDLQMFLLNSLNQKLEKLVQNG